MIKMPSRIVQCGNITNYYGNDGKYSGCSVDMGNGVSYTLNAEGRTTTRTCQCGNQTVIYTDTPKPSFSEVSHEDIEEVRRKVKQNLEDFFERCERERPTSVYILEGVRVRKIK
jgi:hypothetical protein